MDVFDYAFGVEAGPPAPELTHVRPVLERRSPAPGPAGAGDIRSQRGPGAMAVLADSAAAGGVEAALVAGGAATAPGLAGDASSAAAAASAPNFTGGGGAGVHFSSGQPVPGLGAPLGSGTKAPTGFSPTSGPAPAAEGSRSLTGSGFGNPSNPFSGTAPAKGV